MISPSRMLATLVMACCLAGCLLPSANKRPGALTASEGVVRGGMPPNKVVLPAGSADAASGSGVISDKGAGIISNNGASLSGFVRAPASLLSNNGAGIISDNGLGWRVLADADVALRRATVRLLDAAGNPVKGDDGQALSAVTDDKGYYAFAGVMPVSNLILAVSLGEKGQLQAIAPKTGAAARKSDLDVISTLTTRYILDQYVAGQADAQKTLDKLPADVEAETRARATAAFTSSGQATPSDLKDGTVRQVVTAMRAKDTAFDAQMETVKRLLVAAGLSDLGNGQKATDVLLNAISHVLAAPDGGVYLFDGVVWRVTPTGILQRLTAPGPVDAAFAGGPGASARLGPLRQLTLDDQGRLWLLQDAAVPKLWRLAADGTLAEVGGGLAALRLVAPTGGDDFLAVLRPAGQADTLWEVKGAAPRLVHTFTGADAAIAGGLQQMAHVAPGKLVVASAPNTVPKTYHFALESKTFTPIKTPLVDNVRTVLLDPLGTLFYQLQDTGAVRAIAPDGADSLVAGLTSLPFTHGVSRGADGAVYFKTYKQEGSLYRVKDGQTTLYAGKEGQTGQTGNAATATALKRPTGLAVATDGTLYVSDDGALLRFHATEGASTLVGVGALKDGAVALAPARVRLGADGALYFIGQVPFGTQGLTSALWRVKGNAAPERVHGSDRHVEDYLLDADGTIVLAESTTPGPSGTKARLVSRSAGGAVSTLVAESEGLINQIALARDAQGHVLIRGGRKNPDGSFVFDRVRRFTNALGLALLPAGTFWPEARDAQGRELCGWYVSTPEIPKTIQRHDPASGALETIAGPGGRAFSGTGIDDGVLNPQQPAFDAAGNLYFLDPQNKQVKRVAASDL